MAINLGYLGQALGAGMGGYQQGRQAEQERLRQLEAFAQKQRMDEDAMQYQRQQDALGNAQRDRELSLREKDFARLSSPKPSAIISPQIMAAIRPRLKAMFGIDLPDGDVTEDDLAQLTAMLRATTGQEKYADAPGAMTGVGASILGLPPQGDVAPQAIPAPPTGAVGNMPLSAPPAPAAGRQTPALPALSPPPALTGTAQPSLTSYAQRPLAQRAMLSPAFDRAKPGEQLDFVRQTEEANYNTITGYNALTGQMRLGPSVRASEADTAQSALPALAKLTRKVKVWSPDRSEANGITTPEAGGYVGVITIAKDPNSKVTDEDLPERVFTYETRPTSFTNPLTKKTSLKRPTEQENILKFASENRAERKLAEDMRANRVSEQQRNRALSYEGARVSLAQQVANDRKQGKPTNFDALAKAITPKVISLGKTLGEMDRTTPEYASTLNVYQSMVDDQTKYVEKAKQQEAWAKAAKQIDPSTGKTLVPGTPQFNVTYKKILSMMK